MWFCRRNAADIFCRLFQVFTLVLCMTIPSSSETCTYSSSCSCQFTNGTIIDLTSLASTDGPRWSNIKSEEKDNYTYSYNPCYAFTQGKDGDCTKDNVAVCQKSINEEIYQDCGDQNEVQFEWNSTSNTVYISYQSITGHRSTDVILKCSTDPKEEKFRVIGETAVGSKHYVMELTSPCACPGGCQPKGLSTGSSLVIIFFIFLFFYLFLGIVYMHLVRGAHGLELLPHYEFWKDFPLLVRDGCVYVSSGCKNETMYERI